MHKLHTPDNSPTKTTRKCSSSEIDETPSYKSLQFELFVCGHWSQASSSQAKHSNVAHYKEYPFNLNEELPSAAVALMATAAAT